MNIFGEFHGLHVAALQSEYESIDWLRPSQRSTRVRVQRHTCECAAVLYELCAAGGLLHIRRTRKVAGKPVAYETIWLRTAEALNLWDLLLLGRAR